jgi:ABC-type uncharacterized transport system permease subunit
VSISPNAALYAALLLYGIGTLAALGSLFTSARRLQLAGLLAMIGGFVCHTIWIGTICSITGHPPLTNLPEAASFVAWTIFAVELVLLAIYRVQAASFFVYPLVLILLTIAAVVREPFAHIDPALHSRIFIAHVLFATVGVAALLIGVGFAYLSYAQDRALKSKLRGRLWQWIPSLNVCNTISSRALAIGFSIYTIGIITGVVWSYQTTAGPIELRIKQIGAVVAWVLFAVVLQSAINGLQRTRRTMLISACAVIATAVAILGIHHG